MKSNILMLALQTDGFRGMRVCTTKKVNPLPSIGKKNGREKNRRQRRRKRAKDNEGKNGSIHILNYGVAPYFPA